MGNNQSEVHNQLGNDNYQASSSNGNIVSIGSYPSSIVSNASIMVPSGEAVTGIDLSFEGNSCQIMWLIRSRQIMISNSNYLRLND